MNRKPSTERAAANDAQPPHLDLPSYTAVDGFGSYTGFNSVELQEVYAVERQPAVRSQISPRGGQKPCLALLPNGDLLATQKSSDGNVALCRSRDTGLSWEPPREVDVPGRGKLPGRAPMFSALADGTLLLGGPGAAIYRSSDEGSSWQESDVERTVSVDGASYDLFWGENSGPHELSDGTVVCSGYMTFEPGRCRAFLLRSTDGGRTWGDATPLAAASEVNLAVLPGDGMFACLRVQTDGAGEGGAALAVTESHDGGRTWKDPARILGKAQSPGFPVYLSDGRLVITYTHRQFPFGAQAIASRDGGATWDTAHPIILAWFSWDDTCGHPRSLALADGSILTGYYARLFKGSANPSTDVVGHCLRWRPPDDWPPTID